MNVGPYPLNSVIHCDAFVAAGNIPDESIDLIFTDPPYLKKYLPLYKHIFEQSARILKRDGFLLIYVGGYWKDEIMAYARENMQYFWDYIVWEPNNSPVSWQRKTICRNKSIIAYTRKDSDGALPSTQVLSVWLGGGEDKRYHVWGQDESQARYYIDCFSSAGDVVLDFCSGGGTTLVVSKMLGRNFLGFEKEAEFVDVANARIDETNEIIKRGVSDLPAFMFGELS